MATSQQTFRPPRIARENAILGLELRKEHGRGGIFDDETGLDLSHEIAKGSPLTVSKIEQIHEFFGRLGEIDGTAVEKSVDEDGGPSEVAIDFLLRGGESARSWAGSILGREGESETVVNYLTKSLDFDVAKVDEELGIVFGFSIVCKEDGEDYYDTQNDNIPEPVMLKSTFAYMSGDRIAKDSHRGRAIGQVVFGFPLTGEIAKALDIQTARTGFLIGMRPRSDVMAKFKAGDYTGFSIGGRGERTVLA
jgi:hypothetical protein